MLQSNNKIDPRITRSKTALREALLHLMADRSFASISITDIVKQAKYNRGTFYANYSSKEELLNDMLSLLIKDLLHAFRVPYEKSAILNLGELHANTVMVFEHIQTNSVLYSVLTKSDVMPVLKEKMYSALKEIIKEDLVYEESELDPELLVIYSIHALLGLIFHWIESGYVHSTSYMQEQLVKILTRSITNVKMVQK